MLSTRFTGQALVFAIAAVLFSSSAQAKGPQTDLPQNPNDLVRNVIKHELGGNTGNSFYSWRQKTVKPARTIVREMIETPQGVIGRLLSIDGKPLTDEQRKKEESRINRLLDPRQMADKAKEQKQDEERTRKMVGALPDAFIYKYAGTEEKSGHTFVSMTFTPNPNFDPPSKETLVFQGMAGEMTVDATALRIAKIDGTMTKDVSIGWGIIGHLDKGGKFQVDQQEVEKGHWEVTRMRLNFTGRALIFKSIRIDTLETASDFKQVPSFTVAQALDYLKKVAAGPEASGKVAER